MERFGWDRMKCVNCQKETTLGRVVCPACASVDKHMDYLRVHQCDAFVQVKDADKGLCQNFLTCAPIKEALKFNSLIQENLGHVVCPYAYVNLERIINGDISVEALIMNYRECLD